MSVRNDRAKKGRLVCNVVARWKVPSVELRRGQEDENGFRLACVLIAGRCCSLDVVIGQGSWRKQPCKDTPDLQIRSSQEQVSVVMAGPVQPGCGAVGRG